MQKIFTSLIVVFGLSGCQEQVSYYGNEFIHTTTFLGDIITVERCEISTEFTDNQETYYCTEIPRFGYEMVSITDEASEIDVSEYFSGEDSSEDTVEELLREMF